MIEAWRRKRPAKSSRATTMSEAEFERPARRPSVTTAAELTSDPEIIAREREVSRSHEREATAQVEPRRQRKYGRGYNSPQEAAETANDPIRRLKPAREKVMDLLARRNHSELELRRKMSLDYSKEDIDYAIQIAKDSGWMSPPEEIAERAAAELSRKKKGHRYINQFLRNKGLPPVAKDHDLEFEKALALVHAKLAKTGPFDYEEQKKIQRLLANRGYDEDTIRRVSSSRGT